MEAVIERAVRSEMARTVDDILSRRTRHAFVDAAASLALAPGVAVRMAQLLGRDDRWIEEQLAAFRNRWVPIAALRGADPGEAHDDPVP
jgi:glycerol-3-phosphate dehydrogenase